MYPVHGLGLHRYAYRYFLIILLAIRDLLYNNVFVYKTSINLFFLYSVQQSSANKMKK